MLLADALAAAGAVEGAVAAVEEGALAVVAPTAAAVAAAGVAAAAVDSFATGRFSERRFSCFSCFVLRTCFLRGSLAGCRTARDGASWTAAASRSYVGLLAGFD